nr:CPBP family intramembrane metalloprotease [Candidatus Sigynarchaeum springense]
MCLVPFQFLLVVGFSNDWTVNSSFLNPFYIIFIIGGLPVVIFEEVLFRGIYWKYLVIRFAKNKSMTIVFLINAFLFMIIHAPSLFVIYCEALLAGNLLSELAVILILFISYFISGLILTVLRDAHDNLLAPIVYHIAFNVIFLTFTMNGLWLIIIQAVIFLILLTIREMGWFKVSQQHHDKEAIHEFQRPILETPMHSVLRWFFLIGNGMVMFYYGSEMSRGNTPLLLVSSLVIVASYAILAFLYVKRLLFFKLSALMQ